MIKTGGPRSILAAAAIAAGLFVAGCSSSNAGPSTTPAAPTTHTSATVAGSSPSTAAATITITIKNFGYTVSGPAAPNATVQVTNNDSVAHTVTADSGHAFDVTVEPGKSATLNAPAAPGTYKFHCTYHGNMHGTLTVAK